MIRSFILLSVLAVPTFEQNTQHTQDTPKSPCPNVFMYEPPGTEPGRWYGVVNLSTDSTLHSLWLNIVLDSKADILGNWIGDVSTQDNKDFKVENTDMKISPGPAVPVRFFVQYNPLKQAPKLQAIRMNGREICNANTPQPALENVEPTRLTRPETNKPTTKKPQLRPQDIPQTKPIQTTSNEEIRPIYIEPANSRPVLNPRPTHIDSSDASSQSVNSRRPQLTTARPTRGPNRRPGNHEYDDDVSTVDSEDYFQGGPVLVKPITGTITTNTNTQAQNQCGRVVLNSAVPLIVNGTPTLEGQWPWQIALYQTQTVDNKYICGGTLVSHRHVITAAHCVTRKGSRKVVNQNTLTVFLGKHNLRTSVDGVQIRFVDDIVVHPEYNSTTFSRDIAILRLKEPVSYTDWVRPACLWPENLIDLSNVIGKRGSVVGWGFDDTGVATEELSLVQMPVVDTETCIRSYSEFFVRFTSEYTYCAGYRDGSSVCNGDSGGGMVFKTGNTWYLRGLVSLSVARQNEYRCDPTHYVIFTDIAKFLPWIRQHVSDY